MASFATDLRAYNFNPYVTQVPTDDYIRVGMTKQAAYNQGVAKVQGDIDSIAGLDVIKPEQKEYLQQRLGQLTSNVSRIVGQDFSQSQLTNQVGALTNQIASDPIIQSAVSSSARYRSESARMEQAQQKGESSPSNEYDFQDQFSRWMGDKNVKSTFQGSYTPYTDIKKVIKDAVNEKLPPNEQIQDFPFEMENGHVKIDPKTGAPIPAYAMIQQVTKSLTPERVQAAISAAMGPKEWRQLEIDGKYNFRGRGKEEMKRVTDDSYNERLGQINDTLQSLAISKLANPTDKAYQEDLDRRIHDESAHRVSLINQYKNDIEFLDKGNLDQYKGEIYKAGWLHNMTAGLAYSQVSLTSKDNPYFKGMMEEEKNKIDSQRLQLELERKNIDLAKFEFDQRVKLAELESKGIGLGGKPGATSSFILKNPVAGTISQADSPKVDQGAFNKGTQNLEDLVTASKMQLLLSLPETQKLLSVVGGGDAGPQIVWNDEHSKQLGEAAILKLKDDYAAGKITDPDIKEYFASYANAQKIIADRNTTLASVKREADKSTFDVDRAMRNVNGITVTQGGRSFYIDPKEIMAFNTKLNSVLTTPQASFMGGMPGNPTLDEKKAQKLFTSDGERFLYDSFKRMFNKQATPNDKMVGGKIAQINKIIKDNFPDIQKRDAYINNRLKDFVNVKEPASFAIIDKQEGDAQSLVGRLLDNFQKQGAGKLPGGSDADTIGKMYKQKETKYALEVAGNGNYNILMTNPEFGHAQRIPITQQQLDDNFPGSLVNEFADIQNALDLTRGIKSATTDVQGNGESSAYILHNQNLNNYAVKYHIEEPNKGRGYKARLWVKQLYDEQGNPLPNSPWKEDVAPLPTKLPLEELASFLQNFGDQEIKQMYTPKKSK